MLDKMIEKWEEATKSSLETLKKYAKYNADGTGKMTGQMYDTKDFAKIGKTFMETNNELNSIQESFMNTMVRSQLGAMDLKKSAEAIKELEQIRSDSIAKLVENQSKSIHIFMESGAEYLETLKKSRGLSDVVTAQMNMLTEIQEKAKENMLGYIMLSDKITTAMKGWMEKTIDDLSGEADEIPNIPD